MQPSTTSRTHPSTPPDGVDQEPAATGARVLLAPELPCLPPKGRRAHSWPLGVVGRLSRYLPVLTQARREGRDRICSREIAEYTHLHPSQVRRDLSRFGRIGKRGVGYPVDLLIAEIGKILGADRQHAIALIGAGRLGQTIASSSVFEEHGFTIAAVFDVDHAKVGPRIGKTVVSDSADMKGLIRKTNIAAGVLAIPASAAQVVANDLVEAGVKIIVNYSEALLDVPPEVTVVTMSPARDLFSTLSRAKGTGRE